MQSVIFNEPADKNKILNLTYEVLTRTKCTFNIILMDRQTVVMRTTLFKPSTIAAACTNLIKNVMSDSIRAFSVFFSRAVVKLVHIYLTYDMILCLTCGESPFTLWTAQVIIIEERVYFKMLRK